MNRIGGAKGYLFNFSINALAACSASASNVIIMRYKEIRDGINITNEDESQQYGQSKVAAKKAVTLTALSRVMITAFVMSLPGSYKFFY